MQTSLSPSVCRAFLGCQLEKVVDELNLSKKIVSCHPSNLPLPDRVDCFVALNRSPSRLGFSEALLGVHATFDGSMILSGMSRSRESLAGSRIADFTLKLIWEPEQPIMCPTRKLPRYATFRQIKGPR
jgi:hypothetical protein